MTAAAASELYLAALCIWREMRGATPNEQLGCYWVIRNRAMDASKRWPRTYAGVVTQRYQFSSFTVGDANQVRFPIADGGADWTAWCAIWDALNAEPKPDPTRGANSYENLPDGHERPGWADPAKMTTQIGSTRFYRL